MPGRSRSVSASRQDEIPDAATRERQVAILQGCKIANSQAWMRSETRRNATMSRSCHERYLDPGFGGDGDRLKASVSGTGGHMSADEDQRARRPFGAER